MTRKFEALKQGKDKLMFKLQEHGISQDANGKESEKKTVASVSKQKIQNYQGKRKSYICYKFKLCTYLLCCSKGVMKFRIEDVDKILQRLVGGMTPRVAIGLLPGFPAYIIFMCIR